MLPEAGSYASQGTCSVKKKKRKQKFYYSSNKALEKSRMRTANKAFEALLNC
jgi:outer membrane protein assembly factor BamD (BamD/ComL family)